MDQLSSGTSLFFRTSVHSFKALLSIGGCLDGGEIKRLGAALKHPPPLHSGQGNAAPSTWRKGSSRLGNLVPEGSFSERETSPVICFDPLSHRSLPTFDFFSTGRAFFLSARS